MIVCPRCSKENQDHYKFCLGCGAELPRDAGQQPKNFTAPTPPSGMPAPPPGQAKQQDGAAGASAAGAPAAQFGGAAAKSASPSFGGAPVAGSAAAETASDTAAAAAPAGAAAGAAGAPATDASPAGPPAAASQPAAPAAQPQGGTLSCPNCSAQVPANFKFCGTCGHNMQQASAAGAAAASAAASAPAQPAQQTAEGRGRLVLIRPDGTEGDSFPLADGPTTVGRDTAGGLFAGDYYLSPRHATFTFAGNALRVKDEDSLNGVYLRIERQVPVEIADGTLFRVGQEILRFDTITPSPGTEDVGVMGSPDPGYLGRISLVIGRETDANAYCVPPDGLHLGRERGDIIFPDDGYVSGLHCRIHGEGGKIYLTDVGSSNGTFLRIGAEQEIQSGTLLLMGQQLFRAEY